MNTQTTGHLPHLGDDELLRFIDDDGDAEWRADRHRHLETCAACSRELDLLAADAALVRNRVDAAAFEADLPIVPAAGRAHARPRATAASRAPVNNSAPAGTRAARAFASSAWLRAAAVLLLLAAPVVALPGVRGWIVDTIAGDAAPEIATMAAPDLPGDGALIRFVPAAGPFAVSVDAAQEDGTLSIRVDAAAAEAALETLPQAGDTPVEPVISETSLRLRNAPATAASYTLTLPASVTRVTVSIDGVAIADLDAAGLAAGVTLPLQRR